MYASRKLLGVVVPAYWLTYADASRPATTLNSAAVLPLESDGTLGVPTVKGLQPYNAWLSQYGAPILFLLSSAWYIS